MKKNMIFVFGGIVVVSEIIWQLYKGFRFSMNLKKNEKVNARTVEETGLNKSKEGIAEVMFFTKDSSLCRPHVNYTATCAKDNCPGRHMRNLTNYLDRAEKTLDVCMYVLTCQSLVKAIVNAHERGVLVRLITDQQMACGVKTSVSAFHNSGVAIRYQDSETIMHHKFAIVDRKILITGSANWTMTAFFANFESVLVTNQSSFVEPFIAEFEMMWTTFENPLCSKREKPMADIINNSYTLEL